MLIVRNHFCKDRQSFEPVCIKNINVPISENDLHKTTFQNTSFEEIDKHRRGTKLPQSSPYKLYEDGVEITDFTGHAIDQAYNGIVSIKRYMRKKHVLFRSRYPVSYSGYERNKVYEWIPDSKAYFIVYHGCENKEDPGLCRPVNPLEIHKGERTLDCEIQMSDFLGAQCWHYNLSLIHI